MRARRSLAAAAAVAALVLVVGGCSGGTGADEHAADGGSVGMKASPPVAGGAGMKAYIDPETGELRDTPAPGTDPIAGGDVLPPKQMRDGADGDKE